jgi:hypothetical protein
LNRYDEKWIGKDKIISAMEWKRPSERRMEMEMRFMDGN